MAKKNKAINKWLKRENKLNALKRKDKACRQTAYPDHKVEVVNGVVSIVSRYAKLHEDYDDR